MKEDLKNKIQLLLIQAGLEAASGLEAHYSWDDVGMDVWVDLGHELEQLCREEIYNMTH